MANTSRTRKQARLQVEELDQRLVPAGGIVFNPATGILTITGASAANRALVVAHGHGAHQHIVVRLSSHGHLTQRSFSTARVKEIVFHGGKGNDYFLNHSSIKALAFGGAGNDTLIGGAGNDTLVGGTGKDELMGVGDDDVMMESEGEGETAGVQLEAHLTGTAGATGRAEFNATAATFELQIQGAQASTTLDVIVDGTKVGTIMTDASGNGELELTQVSFTVKDQSTIVVGDPNNAGLTGTFQSPASAELKAPLTNATTGVEGSAEFNAAEQKLKIEIEGLPANTTSDVLIDGVKVGQITTDGEGQAELELLNVTQTVTAGSVLTIGAPANPLAQGTFATFGGEGEE
jgi:hypothetical protein